MESASPNLWQQMRVAARRAGLSAFWRWWKGELAALIPARLHNAVQRRRLRPVLAFDADAAVLWVPAVANSHLGYKEAARIPLTADPAATAAAGRAAIERLVAAPRTEAERGRRGSSSRCPRTRCCARRSPCRRPSRTISQQVLAYDLDRHTPFKPDEVYFDAVIVGRDRGEAGNPRRLGGGAQDRRGPGAAAGGKLGRDGRRRDARTAHRPGAARGDRAESASRPPSDRKLRRGAAGRSGMPLALIVGVGARRHGAPHLAEARLRHRARTARRPGARAGRCVERAARAARAAHRRLQLRAAEEIRLSQRAAVGRGRDQAPARRHLAHAARDEEPGEGQGAASRDPPARRERRTRDASFRCSRSRSCSNRRRRGRRRRRSSRARARSSTSVRS